MNVAEKITEIEAAGVCGLRVVEPRKESARGGVRWPTPGGFGTPAGSLMEPHRRRCELNYSEKLRDPRWQRKRLEEKPI
jgi:hypothetical protein